MKKNSITQINRTRDIYNMLANLIWSVPAFLPVCIYGYDYLAPAEILIFSGISFLFLFFPQSFLNRIQSGRSKRFYKRSGVLFINKFVQNGKIINSLLQRKYPGYKVISVHKRSISKMIQQTYLYEKFHFFSAAFFIFLTVHAGPNH